MSGTVILTSCRSFKAIRSKRKGRAIMARGINDLLGKMDSYSKGNANKPKKASEKKVKKPKEKRHSEFRVVCINDFLEEDIPPRECILDPWLPEQGLAMIYAPRGIGKTFFSLEIAYAVATGGQFLNWKTKEPAPVLYLDGEMAQADLQSRLKGISEDKGEVEKGYLKIVTPDRQKRGIKE